MTSAMLRKFWKLRVFAKSEASQIVELAITLPLLAVVVIGLTDFSSAFNLKFRLDNAAREGARFSAGQSKADLSNGTPNSIVAVRDLIDNYLTSLNINDCGLSTALPTNSGLVWTYNASTGCPLPAPTALCPGNVPLSLTIDRGYNFPVGTMTVEATHIKICYPYQWRFNSVIQVLVPGASYAGLTHIPGEAVVQNLN